jgi:hypothetical protein
MPSLVLIAFVALMMVAALLGARAKKRSERFVEELGELAAARTIKCGFRMRKGSGYRASLPFGRLHVDAERIGVRPVTMAGKGFCMSRTEARVCYSRVLGMRGLQVMGETVGFDVIVDDLDGLVADLTDLGWSIEDRAQ